MEVSNILGHHIQSYTPVACMGHKDIFGRGVVVGKL